MANSVKQHETNVATTSDAQSVNDILQSVENVPFALNGATTKTILYALFSVLAASELTSALGFYTASLGVSLVGAFTICGFVASAFHYLLHSILSGTAHGIVFKKRAESKAMSTEVVANIILSIVLLLAASCTVFFVGKKGFSAYRATEFETKMKAATPPVSSENTTVTPQMLTSKRGKISVYKLELLGKLEQAKAASTDATTNQNTTEKDSYDRTTNTITDIVGASAFVLEMLLALLAFTIATAKKAAVIEEIVRRKENNVTQENVTITTKNDTKRNDNDRKGIVTQQRYDSEPLRYDNNNLPKPSENNDKRTIVSGFSTPKNEVLRNDADPKKVPCGSCKTPFLPKNARHKFCSDSCRLEAWQAKNGTTVFGTK
jgi:hypothetical protein